MDPRLFTELGATKPWGLPAWLVRVAAGDFAAQLLTKGRGASNAKAKRELSWFPSRPTWLAGFLAP